MTFLLIFFFHFSVGQKITKRMFPMSVQTFLNQCAPLHLTTSTPTYDRKLFSRRSRLDSSKWQTEHFVNNARVIEQLNYKGKDGTEQVRKMQT